MTDEPINLSRERVKRSNDSRDWTAAEALESVANDVREGKFKPTKILILAIDEEGIFKETTNGTLVDCLGLLDFQREVIRHEIVKK